MVLPNQLTVMRIILTPVFFVLFLIDNPLCKQIALAVFVIAALTDWYDGWLARKYNYITDWGKFWDPLADKILTAAAFIALVIIGVLQLWMVILILLRDFIITGLRSFADYKKVSFSTSRYAKWKTFIQMAFLYYLLLVQAALVIPSIYQNNIHLFEILLNKNFIYFAMLFVTIITVHSGITYFFKNRRLIRKLFTSET
jgi:CDP-diacylglycerol--glycerol-3-phosphate 3-phosphatidyltransferase